MPEQLADPSYDAAMRLVLELEKLRRDREASERQSQDRRAAAFYAADSENRANNVRARTAREQTLATIINNLLDNQQQSDTQQAIADRQLAYASMSQQADMANDPIEAELRIYEDYMNRELPEPIRAGLASGELVHKRDQLRELAEIEDAITKADRAANLTPLERAMFKRERAQRRWDILTQPIKNPSPPLTPQQEASQLTWKDLHEPSGKVIEWQFEDRNGLKRKVPTAAGKADLDDWLADQEDRRKRDFELWKRDNGLAGGPTRESLEERQANARRNQASDARYKEELERLGPRPNELDPDYETKLPLWLDARQSVVEKYHPLDEQPSTPSTTPLTPPSTPAAPSAPATGPVQSPQELAAKIRAGELNVGDTIETHKGPRPLTMEIITKLISSY